MANVNHTTKIERLIDDYDQNGLGTELERRWLGEEGERQSLRSLAEWVDKTVLSVAFDRIDEEPIEGEIDHLYHLLTGDEVSNSAREQAKNRLREYGLEVDEVLNDFVSHQAVHTYLTEVRGVSLESRSKGPHEFNRDRRANIQKLRNRLVEVTRGNLANLDSTDRLTLGSFDVTVSVTVHCTDCGRSLDVIELFDNGGCDC